MMHDVLLAIFDFCADEYQVTKYEIVVHVCRQWRDVPVVSDTFLGRSAPRLRIFALGGIPFPGLPKLLMSATHLVYLHLSDIPHSGYISPDAMITAL